jgi:CheY-like chemotaxis protein
VEGNDEKNIAKLPYLKEKVLVEKHVLIVDDDVRNIFSLTKLLESQKMKVSTASDGNEALEILKNENNIDLILMDMMMPNKDGYETIEDIRKDLVLKNIPIIAVTARAMMGDREKCIKIGANDYVTKPVDGDRLLSLLRVWLYNK